MICYNHLAYATHLAYAIWYTLNERDNSLWTLWKSENIIYNICLLKYLYRGVLHPIQIRIS